MINKNYLFMFVLIAAFVLLFIVNTNFIKKIIRPCDNKLVIQNTNTKKSNKLTIPNVIIEKSVKSIISDSTNSNSPQLILKYHRSDNLTRKISKMEFYDDTTYNFFQNDKLLMQGKLTDHEYTAIKFFQDNIDNMQKEYRNTKSINDYFDGINCDIECNNKRVSFNEQEPFDKEYIPADIKKHLQILDNISIGNCTVMAGCYTKSFKLIGNIILKN
jgi:hypothetical protein